MDPLDHDSPMKDWDLSSNDIQCSSALSIAKALEKRTRQWKRCIFPFNNIGREKVTAAVAKPLSKTNQNLGVVVH